MTAITDAIRSGDKELSLRICKHIVRAIYDTILECGDMGAPEGPMYAAFMKTGLGFSAWEVIIDSMIKQKLITRVSHVLYPYVESDKCDA